MTPTRLDPRCPVHAARRRFALAAAAACAAPGLACARSDPALVLASTFDPDDARFVPADWLVSEKYDGVRAAWDGRVLRHRSGRTVAAPPSFLATLPAEPLDGELWLGRRRFDALSAIVRRAVPVESEWASVRYMVFELPAAGGRFDERAARLEAIVAARASRATRGDRDASPLRVAGQKRCVDRAALRRRFDEVVAGGGEGLVLHRASAPVQAGRSDDLRKWKPWQDAEATVRGLVRGSGRNADRVGALDVEAGDGRRFRIGSGLDDASRDEPPPIGSVVTYRYRDLTPSGLPRFATYLRRHDAL